MVLTNTRIWRDFIISRDSDFAEKKALDESFYRTQVRRNTHGNINAKTHHQILELRKSTFQKI